MQNENENEEENLCPECGDKVSIHSHNSGCLFRNDKKEHCPCKKSPAEIELLQKVKSYESLFGPGMRDKLYMALKDYVDRVNFSASRGDIASRDASIELAIWAESVLPKLQIK